MDFLIFLNSDFFVMLNKMLHNFFLNSNYIRLNEKTAFRNIDRGQSNFLEHLQGPNNEKSEGSFNFCLGTI